MADERRVLVTGGAGFIGANLVRVLVERGHEVTVLDNLTSGQTSYLAGLELQLAVADVRNSEQVFDAIAGHRTVVHLAAQTGVPGSLEDPRHDCDVNVTGTLNMLEACRNSGARFVFASSNAPLGRQKPPATEDKAPLPVSPYGASKLAGEGYCLAYHGSWGVDTVAFRFGNVYGPYSAHKESVVAKFFKRALAGERLVIDGDGEQTRDFVYV
ncbi:MAG: NAD-dependent epimerase/dehydratase family protein, partial [Acidobacteriota bacterium]